MDEHLTRREALVAALAATALGGALVRPVATRAAAGADATANIAVILPLTKNVDAVAANNVLKVARLWASAVNARGGVDGQQVVLKVYDDRRSPERGAKAVKRAVTNDHCSVILGGFNSDVALAEGKEAHRLTTPLLVSYAWSVEITKAGYPEVVRIGPNNDMLANSFAPFMVKRKYKRIAIVAEDTAFGQGLGESIRTTATLAGIDVAAEAFPPDSRDLRPTLKRMLAHKPDALVVVAQVVPGRTLAITQARSAGFDGDVVLGWDYVDDEFWKSTGKHGAGVIWPTFSAPKLHLTATGQAFKTAYSKKYKRAPLFYEALTWDQLSAWKWAADKAGSVAPADVVPRLQHVDMEGTMGRITLSSQRSTVHYNQWEGVTVYFDQAPKTGLNDATAKVLAAIKGSAS